MRAEHTADSDNARRAIGGAPGAQWSARRVPAHLTRQRGPLANSEGVGRASARPLRRSTPQQLTTHYSLPAATCTQLAAELVALLRLHFLIFSHFPLHPSTSCFSFAMNHMNMNHQVLHHSQHCTLLPWCLCCTTDSRTPMHSLVH